MKVEITDTHSKDGLHMGIQLSCEAPLTLDAVYKIMHHWVHDLPRHLSDCLNAKVIAQHEVSTITWLEFCIRLNKLHAQGTVVPFRSQPGVTPISPPIIDPTKGA